MNEREFLYHFSPNVVYPRLVMRLVQGERHFLQAATNLTGNFTTWETFWTMVRVLLEEEARPPKPKVKLW